MSASVSVLSHMFSSSPQWLVFSTRSPPGRVVSSCSSPFGTKSFCILLRAFPPGFCSCRIAALCRLFPWWSLANPRPFCGFPWLPPPLCYPMASWLSWLFLAPHGLLLVSRDSPRFPLAPLTYPTFPPLQAILYSPDSPIGPHQKQVTYATYLKRKQYNESYYMDISIHTEHPFPFNNRILKSITSA